MESKRGHLFFLFVLGQKVLTKTDINANLFKYSKRKGEKHNETKE